MRVTVCIPNYNYERYLERAIMSALDQRSQDVDVQVVVSDNASTDASVALVEPFVARGVRLHVNETNVGFAANLDRAVSMAEAEWLLVLSSDDIVCEGAFAAYDRVLRELSTTTIISSTCHLIDGDDQVTGSRGPDPALWLPGDRDRRLEGVVGAPVFRVDGRTLLGRCVDRMRNPFNFAATMFPHALWNTVGGYRGARLVNPDKWFHWRLLAAANQAVFVDKPLFGYRWHDANQTAQQLGTGALKLLVDDYATTLELDDAILSSVGRTRLELVTAFVEHDIVRHGLATLARGDRLRAKRILRFGMATYPHVVRRNPRAAALQLALLTGPLGRVVATRAHAHAAGRRAVHDESVQT